MASLANLGGKRWLVQFYDRNGKRATIRLSKMSDRQAETVRLHVEALASAAEAGRTPDRLTEDWARKIGDDLAGRLAGFGLIPARSCARLGEWLDGYLEQRRADLKPGSLAKLQQTRGKLTAFLGADRPLRDITVADAAGWWAGLKTGGLTEAAAKIHGGNAKQFGNEWVRRGIVQTNPFEHVKSGATASKTARYITPAEIAAILAECTDPEARLALGLARYAGLRFMTEHAALTWGDWDLARGRLRVRSIKTESHGPEHAERVVPVCPELAKILQDAFDHLPEGGRPELFTTSRSVIVRAAVKAIRAAGLVPWGKLFQSLRASCETQWAMTYPAFAVATWMGHSIDVSARHYTRVVDELFDKAAGGSGALQKAQQQSQETSGNDEQAETGAEAAELVNSCPCPTLPDSAVTSDSESTWRRGGSNP